MQVRKSVRKEVTHNAMVAQQVLQGSTDMAYLSVNGVDLDPARVDPFKYVGLTRGSDMQHGKGSHAALAL